MGGIPNLRTLWLGDNQLSGQIPPELGSLSKMADMRLSGNRLSGRIPSELGGLSNIVVLWLDQNQLNGEIPSELGDLSSLRWMLLGGNQFSGCIPEGLRYVERNDLDELDMPYCDLLLSRLTIAPGSLNPAFDPYRNYYIAAVGSASHFTVSPVNDYNATIRFLDENYVEAADANGTLAGHQVNVSDGTTTVNIRVISLDESVTHTYTIQASRKPMTLNACAAGGAVSDPANYPGLVSDCVALLSTRDTLAGSASLNWSEGTPIQDWDGVTVGRTPQRVTEVRLALEQLSGSIPTELGDLSNLAWLNLAGNELSGSIPAELGDLSNLERLYLGGNELSGAIPAELGDLSNLTQLGLYGNQLSGPIPTELGGLPNLRGLTLGGNQLSGQIPPELGGLSSLTVLDLGGNQLSGPIPAELGDLSNLKGTGEWTSLTGLDLSRNQLSGPIPAELGDLSNLKGLDLRDNELSGTVPAELGDLSNLTRLDLSDNRLSGTIPAELGDLSNLTRLALSGNQLSGEIPGTLTSLTVLEWLIFINNQGLCAPVGDEFQTWFQNIATVRGSSCAPVDSLEDRAALARLYNATEGGNWENSSNWLTDRPMREWYGVTNDAQGRVIGLYLNLNQLSGSIPPELGSLSNLTVLELRVNQLSGPIPPELGGLSNLELLYLDQNELSGTIPPELGGLYNLELLYLYSNRLRRYDTAGVGKPLQIDGPVPWLQPVERFDTSRAG